MVFNVIVKANHKHLCVDVCVIATENLSQGAKALTVASGSNRSEKRRIFTFSYEI